MKFTAVLKQNGKTATGIPVPPEVVEALAAGKKPKVAVTIGKYTYRSSIAPWGDGYMLPFSAEHRAATGIVAGTSLEVDVELDEAPREVELDAEFAAALKRDALALKCFEALSYSKKRWFTLGIADAKKPETKTKRIEKFVTMLHDGKTP